MLLVVFLQALVLSLKGRNKVLILTVSVRILEALYLGNFGTQRMKQFARTTVYWPGIDSQMLISVVHVKHAQNIYVN